MSKIYKPGQIADTKLKLQELNTNNNSTKKDIVDVPKGGKIPPTSKPNYTFKKV